MIVIADEAHRSQYGFRAKIEGKTGKISYGFAKYPRDGLPNASFIGFTETPIEADDVNTPAVFGDYIDMTGTCCPDRYCGEETSGHTTFLTFPAGCAFRADRAQKCWQRAGPCGPPSCG